MTEPTTGRGGGSGAPGGRGPATGPWPAGASHPPSPPAGPAPPHASAAGGGAETGREPPEPFERGFSEESGAENRGRSADRDAAFPGPAPAGGRVGAVAGGGSAAAGPRTRDGAAPEAAADTGPEAVRRRLEETGYLVDEGLAIACHLALTLHRPLFCEGDAGVGKTSLASALARATGAELIRLQCYEGIDVSQALYDWDFPRQLLHLRAAEAAGATDAEALESELYGRRFLVARPLLKALETRPAVLLIDEVDRADDEFEAFLLELLSEYAVTIPELGTLHAETPPVVVLTSNRTREVHDALKRRCLYHWFDHPGFARELAIVRSRLPQVSERLAAQVTTAVQALRRQDLLKPPGVAETIDWAEALDALGAGELDAELAVATLGSVLKYKEDTDKARTLDLAAVLAASGGG